MSLLKNDNKIAIFRMDLRVVEWVTLLRLSLVCNIIYQH